MDGTSPTIILLLAAATETARRWAKILEGPQTTVWQRPLGASQGRPEVIVTDRAEVESRQAGDPALVRIGGDGPADVRLPADCSPRELSLACQLLAQIVRLRRRERQAAEIHHELSVQALSDVLTGLPNRRAWDLALTERAGAATGGCRLCLAILDLDHFKQINDVHGHVAGDEVLRATGQGVYDDLRQDDFVARLGGDEFGLLLWVPDDEAALAIIERVRTALPGHYQRAGLPVLTASAGYRLSGGRTILPPALPRGALPGGRFRACARPSSGAATAPWGGTAARKRTNSMPQIHHGDTESTEANEKGKGNGGGHLLLMPQSPRTLLPSVPSPCPPCLRGGFCAAVSVRVHERIADHDFLPLAKLAGIAADAGGLLPQTQQMAHSQVAAGVQVGQHRRGALVLHAVVGRADGDDEVRVAVDDVAQDVFLHAGVAIDEGLRARLFEAAHRTAAQQGDQPAAGHVVRLGGGDHGDFRIGMDVPPHDPPPRLAHVLEERS